MKAMLLTAPNKIGTYFQAEHKNLSLVAFTGIIYNMGMIAGPWFEGHLAQCLWDIMAGQKQFSDMIKLASAYVGVIVVVQGARFLKRLYVRKFANNINLLMKDRLYANIVHTKKIALEQEGAGPLMTKAISDVDTCVEGVRKFTTEVFDTGVVMVAYIAMLLYYDWRLALLSLVFPPVAYGVAEKLKIRVAQCARSYKESAGQLNAATLDRIAHGITYRLYGQETHMNELYENHLQDYEGKAVATSIWENALQPIYQFLSTLSVIFILWYGGQNVLGYGWTEWNIAAFTTFFSCFMKLALKSSKAAKLFNSVQKAQVSWQRVKPYLQPLKEKTVARLPANGAAKLAVVNLKFKYSDGTNYILDHINFTLNQGEILGVAGTIASGKSTLGKVFLGEEPYEGHIYYKGVELKELQQEGILGITTYLGHQPELLSTSIEDNILLGDEGDVWPYLQAVCLAEEVQHMPQGIHTLVGNGGVTLSGGQQARLALARTLFHKNKIMILDDPFAAVDMGTEQKIMGNIKPLLADSITVLISHRLAIFPQLNTVLWLDNKVAATHKEQLATNAQYARAYALQRGGIDHASPN